MDINFINQKLILATSLLLCSMSEIQQVSIYFIKLDICGHDYAFWTVSREIDRARICKRLRDPRIDSKESIPPAYVAWRAGTITLFHLGY